MNPVIDQVFFNSVIRFFLVFGVVAMAVGLGLIYNSAGMHGLFGRANHWVSMRHSVKWLAVPRDSSITSRYLQALFGFLFVAAAVYSTFVLVIQVDVASVTSAFRLDISQPYVGWIIESVRWMLIIGGLLVIPTGLMMIFFPDKLHNIESHTNHWYSFRSQSLGCDTMHMAFDRWVERYPRATGMVITAGALLVVVQYGMLFFISP